MVLVRTPVFFYVFFIIYMIMSHYETHEIFPKYKIHTRGLNTQLTKSYAYNKHTCQSNKHMYVRFGFNSIFKQQNILHSFL